LRKLWPAFLAGLILLGLALAAQLAGATYGAAAPPPPPIRAEPLSASDRGRLRIVEGIPVLRLAGTPREMGRQHGRILRRQIRYLQKEYFEAMLVKVVGRRNLEQWTRAVEPYLPAEMREEMEGLAEGSGLSYRDILHINTMTDRLQALFCSTVVAAGDATRNGEVFFGRNLDFPGRNMLQKTTVVIVYRPEGGTPLAAVTWPGLIGVLSGMNARGVAGATMLIHRGRGIRPGLPYMLMYRAALARAARTRDVYDFILAAKRTTANNFMVVDAAGAAELLEYDPEVVVRRKAERGTLCSTNFFKSKELAGRCFPVGRSRYESLDRFLDREAGRIDLGSVVEALREVARPWYLNVQSMVFLPKRRAIYLSVGGKLPAARQRFVMLDRSVLFGGARDVTGGKPARAAR